jgi:hypothetical protein
LIARGLTNIRVSGRRLSVIVGSRLWLFGGGAGMPVIRRRGFNRRRCFRSDLIVGLSAGDIDAGWTERGNTEEKR